MKITCLHIDNDSRSTFSGALTLSTSIGLVTIDLGESQCNRILTDALFGLRMIVLDVSSGLMEDLEVQTVIEIAPAPAHIIPAVPGDDILL